MKLDYKKMDKKIKFVKSYVTFKQRITGWLVAAFLLSQIFIPSIAAAATLVSNTSISSAMLSSQFQKSQNSNYQYEQAVFGDSQFISGKNITTFHDDLIASKINVGAPKFVPIAGDITIFVPTYPVGKLIGDNYVQNRYIRQQIINALGRHLIDAATDTDEIAQINRLYNNAKTFAINNNATYKYGDNLAANVTITIDMVWPERRTINGEEVMVPILYLTQDTLTKFAINDHKIEFLGGSATFKTVTLDHTKLVSGVNTLIKTTGDLKTTNSTISSEGNISLVVGGTLSLLSSAVDATKNIFILAGQVNAKTLLQPFFDKNGSGTRLGRITNINSSTGNITIGSLSDIQFEGSTVTATNGSITLNANNNINILPIATSSERWYSNGSWFNTISSLDVVGSKLSANEMISLAAGGEINITASQIISTLGGVELLAQNGIYVLDDQGQTLVKRQKYTRRTSIESSDFKSWAIRSVLNAGKGVLLATEEGDIKLKAAQITSSDGTTINARNGKVHLLITKEQSQYLYNSVRRGTWTTNTDNRQDVTETPIYNAIVGGIAVEALQGVDIEYAGAADIVTYDMDENGRLITTSTPVTLDDQMQEFRKMPGMKWMTDIYDNRNGKYGTKVDWQKVDLLYKHVKQTNTALTPALMIIIVIIVSILTDGAGSAIVGDGAATATAGTMTAAEVAIAQAAVTTLATSATVNLAEGKGFEGTLDAMMSDDGLKSLAIAMATAGALSYLNINELKLFGDQTKGMTLQALSNQAYQAVVSATVTAGISVTINGGNRDDFKKQFTYSLAANAFNQLGQNLSDKITQSPTLTEASKYIAHAGMGCLTAGLTSKLSNQDFNNACVSGAGGAVLSQAITDKLQDDIRDLVTQANDNPSSNNVKNVVDHLIFYQKNGVNITKLIAAITAFALKGDINAAANSATIVAQSSMYKLADIAQTYLSFTGGAVCAQADFAQCATTKAENELAQNLKAAGKSDAEIQQAKVLLHDLNLKLGILLAVAYQNGDFANKLAEKHQTTGGTTTDNDNVVVEVLSQGQHLNELQTAIFDVESAGGKFLNENPAQKLLLEYVIAGSSFGWTKAAIVMAGGAALALVAPDKTKEQMAAMFDKISRPVGNASVAFVLGTDSQNIEDAIVDGGVADFKNASDFSSWMIGQIIFVSPVVREAGSVVIKNASVVTGKVKDAFKNIFLSKNVLARLSETEWNALRGTGLTDVEIVSRLEVLGDLILFRGSTEGYFGTPILTQLGISPASIDPVVATIFAIEGRAFGAEPILQFGSKTEFGNPLIDLGNVRSVLEREVQVGLSPEEFASRAPNVISADLARQILSDMNVVNLPTVIRSTQEATQILENTPRLTPAQIAEFIARAKNGR